jgi:hyperosmotically inducible protein
MKHQLIPVLKLACSSTVFAADNSDTSTGAASSIGTTAAPAGSSASSTINDGASTGVSSQDMNSSQGGMNNQMNSGTTATDSNANSTTTTTTTTTNESSSADTAMTNSVQERFQSENLVGGTSGGNIKVETRNGTVYLTGTVKTQADADRAALAAQSVNGVQNVDNKITVEGAADH